MSTLIVDRSPITVAIKGAPGGTELLSSDGAPVQAYNELSFTINNVGANSIGALEVYWCDDWNMSTWVRDTSVVIPPPGSIPPGGSIMVDFTDIIHGSMRIFAAANIGSTDIVLSLIGR